MERVATGGLGAAGLDWCLLAVDEQAVELLLVEADASAPGRACDRCDWLASRRGVPDRREPDAGDARRRRRDGHPRAGHRRPRRARRADTPLRDHLVAALLRFPVPRP